MLNYENNVDRIEYFKKYLVDNGYSFNIKIALNRNDCKFYLFIINKYGLNVSNIQNNKLLAEYLMGDFIKKFKSYSIG